MKAEEETIVEWISAPLRLRREGDDYVVRLPIDAVEGVSIRENDLVRVHLELVEALPRLRPELQESVDEILRDPGTIEALNYLRDH